MAGLIAANLLRRHRPVVYEAQSQVPNNHGALLRFRSDAVARAVNQPFKQVNVTKGVKWKNSVSDSASLQASNLYSLKVTGGIWERSIMNLQPSVRWIAPEGFCSDLANGVVIRYDQPVNDLAELGASVTSDEGPVISTIPMPAMMKMVDWELNSRFEWKQIWSIRARIVHPPLRVYQTIYYPDPEVPFYRASITGDLLIIESMSEPKESLAEFTVHSVLQDFGINYRQAGFLNHEGISIVPQKYGKLLPYSETERRAFILALTDRFGIYSLGRFATWRQILLDDIVQDVRIIDRLITERDAYSRHLLHKD